MLGEPRLVVAFEIEVVVEFGTKPSFFGTARYLHIAICAGRLRFGNGQTSGRLTQYREQCGAVRFGGIGVPSGV